VVLFRGFLEKQTEEENKKQKKNAKGKKNEKLGLERMREQKQWFYCLQLSTEVSSLIKI
jgi:hypothetical protein